MCIRNHSKIKPCSFKLQVNSLSPETVPTFSTNTTPTATATISPDPATAKCDNCLAWIPKDRFTMHTAFCYRNQVLCKKCSSVFPKSEFDDHAHCSDCNASGSTTAGFLEKHRFFEHTLMVLKKKGGGGGSSVISM